MGKVRNPVGTLKLDINGGRTGLEAMTFPKGRSGLAGWADNLQDAFFVSQALEMGFAF